MKHLMLILLALCPTLFAVEKPDIVVFFSDDHGQLDSTPYGSK
jgi:hypothetical protein